MGTDDRSQRFRRQAESYRFPYHWVPATEPHFSPSRVMGWALEYFAVIDATLDLLRERDPARVLDVGCGDGRVAAAVHDELSAEVVGVDVTEQAISFAELFNSHRPRVSFVCGDVTEVPGEFDAAILVEVLEHIPGDSVASAVASIASRLHPDGTLVVSVPTTRRAVEAKHERHYDVDLLSEHLAPHFRIESRRYVHREGLVARVIEQAVANRVFALREPRALRALEAAYARWVAGADERSGAHLVARCRPFA